MAVIKNLSLSTTIEVEGTDRKVTVDFSDIRLARNLAVMLKKWEDFDTILKKKLEECETIEDELDRFIALGDAAVGIFEDFKNDFNKVFNSDIVGAVFGDCVPSIDRYFPLLEELTPIMQASLNRQSEYRNLASNSEYSLMRIKGNLAQAQKSKVFDFDFQG